MVNFMKKISLGNILKNMRLTNTTLSQKELGKKLSLSDTTISSYERENSEPDFHTLLRIADICDYDIRIYNRKAKEFISLEYYSKEL